MTDERAYDHFVAALDALDTSSWEVLRYRPPAGAVNATIQFDGEEKAAAADVLDISRHAIGLLVIPRQRPQRGQPCRVNLTLANGQIFTLAGRVLWLDSSRSALAMGIAVGLTDPPA